MRKRSAEKGNGKSGDPARPGADTRQMFSPASFYDVLNAPTSHKGMEPRAGKPEVVAFYGFKGGAGRTMALAHAAAILAQRGSKIVAVDLDLEAPGLDIVFDLPPADAPGTAQLLRTAVMAGNESEPLDVASSLRPVQFGRNDGGLWVLPAGSLNETYLATIEELHVGAWHSLEVSPLQRLLDAIVAEFPADLIFLDCRTGFDALSATALFHVANLNVVFFPLSPQAWTGLNVITSATAVTRKRRGGIPDLVLVPTLVPPGPGGRDLLASYAVEVEQRYENTFSEEGDQELAEDPDAPSRLLLEKGIPYDATIATTGRLDQAQRSTAWGHYRELADYIGGTTTASHAPSPAGQLAVELVLRQVRMIPFGEEVPLNELIDSFVAPADLARILDRSSALVIGAKGAGKTWLFRYLVGSGAYSERVTLGDMKYLVGHAPSAVQERGALHLSAEALKEIEQSARMVRSGSHLAFWRLYVVARIVEAYPGEAEAVQAEVTADDRKLLRALRASREAGELQKCLARFLLLPEIGTQSERLLQKLDSTLLWLGHHVTVVLDGLDTGFDVGTSGEERQDRFVKALLQLVLDRGHLRRIHFKVFLREDVYLRIEMQNKSHLESTTVELRWRPEDLWRMALVRAKDSAEYQRYIDALPGGREDPSQLDELTLRRLLEPLWGATVQAGRRARTAIYIQKRTSDAVGRLFPRTLMQLLGEAVKFESRASSGGSRDRVLRFPAIRHGVEAASKQRVEDLKREYNELGRYLDGLRGRNPTGTPGQFIQHLSRKVERKATVKRGVEAGALQAGPGGWKKVIQLLEYVGVLGEYKRARGEGGEPRLAVALLYRPGLDMKASG